MPREAAAAPVFAALGDPVRLRLVRTLSSRGPSTSSRLTAGLPITRQAVDKHLRVLAAAGVVRGERSGRERVWELLPSSLDEAQRSLDRISRGWDAVLERLRALVETD